MAKGKGGGGSFRSAISRRFVTAKHGKASPRTTGGGSTGGTYRSAISGRFVTSKQARRAQTPR